MEIKTVEDINGFIKQVTTQYIADDLFHFPAYRPMLVGLTGGIGCGKTTVLREFQSLGVPCFVADDKAGQYYEDSTFLKEIRAFFGDKVFLLNGAVDKQAIAKIVFHDKDMLTKLNALVHPRVMHEFACWASQQTTQYVIMESAILFEYGLNRPLQKVVSVYLEKEERLRRLEERDHVSREALEARMNNQLSAEEKMDLADYVVLNYEGNPRTRQVTHIHTLLLQDAEKYSKQ